MIDVTQLQTAHNNLVIDLRSDDIDQFSVWQIESNLPNHTHPLIQSNDPVFRLRGYTQDYFAKIRSDKKIIAVEFFIPTNGYANFDSAGNLFTDWSLRDQQLEFVISYFEHFNEIDKDLVISFCDESPDITNVLETLYSLMAIYDIPEHRVILMGHNFAGQEIVNNFAKENGEVPLKYIVGWWMLGHMNTSHIEGLCEYYSDNTYSIKPLDKTPKQNTFIFLNRRETSNRLALSWLLWERRIKAYDNIISVCPPLRLFGLDVNRDTATPSEGEVRNHYTPIFFQTLLKSFSYPDLDSITELKVKLFVEEMRVGKVLEGDHAYIGDIESKFIPQDNNAYIWLTCESTSELKNKNLFFTEKVLKPMVYGQALVVFAQPGFIKAFKKLGFYTLADELGVDESYDDIINDGDRLKFIADQMEKVSKIPLLEMHEKWLACENKINHNKKIIFSMLSNLRVKNFMDNQSRYIVSHLVDQLEHSSTDEALKSYKNFVKFDMFIDN